MKKFLLTCAAVLGIGAFASADEATFIAPEFTGQTGTKLVNKDGSNTQGSNTDINQSLCGIDFTEGNITLTFDQGTSGNVPGAYGNGVRWFQGANLTVTPASGTTIEKIYVQTISNSKGNFTAKVGETAVGTVTGSGSGATNPITWEGSVSDAMTLNATKQVRFSYITVTYTVGEAPAVSKPVISPNGGYVKTGDKIAIECATDGAEIYYTLDGDTPDKSSDKYTGEIIVNETADFTLTAVAYKGEDVSATASANFKVMPVLSALNEIMEQAKGAQVVIDTEVVVTYKNGAYNYIYDANGYCFGLIYGYNFAPAVGDKIAAGWTATVDNFKGLWQFASPEGCTVTESNVELPEPMPTNGYMLGYTSAAMQCQLMTLQEVTFEEATPVSNTAFTGTLENEDEPEGFVTANFYNQFKIESVEPGIYNVTAYVSVRQNSDSDPVQIQFFPIAYEPVEPVEFSLYIAGEFNNWDYDNAPKMEFDGVETYTYTAEFNGEKAFAISEALGEDFKWMTYMTEDGTVKVGETTTLDYDYDGIGKITFEGANGEYKITVVKGDEGMTLNVTSTSGIADIEAADTEARYFNLQGVEVANPATGVYIRVAGGKATKVLVD